MKKMKKYFALFVALAMVLGTMSLSVFAAKTTDSGKGGNASITINLPTDNAGKDSEITYHIYKVFDATSAGGTSTAIAYQIDSENGPLSDAMTAAGFSVDSAGNVSFTGTMDENGNPNANDTALNAIAAYAVDEVGTTGFTAKPSDGTLTITGLEYGYYYITTSTGTAITVDSTNPTATVNDKNTIPTPPDKKVTGVGDGSLDAAGKNAIAQVGTTVNFSADIVKVKGAENYVFHDVMTTGLSYNDDVKVYLGTTEVAATNYDKTKATNDTLTVTFNNTWLATLSDNTTITIKYSARVTSDALQTDAAHNTATLDYGDGHTTNYDQVNVYNAKFSVVKYDSSDSSTIKDDDHTVEIKENETTTWYKALPGAGFVISKTVADTSEDAEEGATKKVYYSITNGVVSWVDSIDDATEYTSTANGALDGEFTGLADGTYTLEEKTVPAGYNKAADSTFTVNAATAANATQTVNLIQSSDVGNASGQELPDTGGIGTTIFYVLGTILVLAAGVLLVTRRRMRHSEE